jgi:hypothetical protein
MARRGGARQLVALLVPMTLGGCASPSGQASPCELLTETDAERLLDVEVVRASFAMFEDIEPEEAERLDAGSCIWVPSAEKNLPASTRHAALWLNTPEATEAEYLASIDEFDRVANLGEYGGVTVRETDREVEVGVVVNDSTWFTIEVVGSVDRDAAVDVARAAARRLS